MPKKKVETDCSEACEAKCLELKKELAAVKKELAAAKKTSGGSKLALLQEYFNLSENGWKDRSEKEKVINRKNEIIAKLK